MLKRIGQLLAFITIFAAIFLSCINSVEAKSSEPLILDETTKKHDMYPAIDIFKDREMKLTIDDVVSDDFFDKFIPSDEIIQKKGFFKRINWLRFEVKNESNQNDWLLEFAFPLINDLQIYTKEDDEIKLLYKAGSDLPFNQRKVKHRHFIYNVDIKPRESKTFYALAVGSGDLHPPITIWDKDTFIEKTQREFVLLGLFYGIILVMILYNLFLYFSLRLKSYLYYVIAMIFTLLGKISINGLGFQYLWPNAPGWNLISAPVWVPLACIFVLIFSRHFLDIDRYFPSFKRLLFILIPLNAMAIISLPFSRYIALYFMVIAALSTFLVVLTVAIICLKRGARQARFYIAGWVIFLTGVSVTILERAVILPFTVVTEYAGQAALTIEVVLLSLALADKIKIMRKEKELAEKKSQESQELALQNLQKADELKDEFLAITSHELRTPLYGMIGIAESLRDGITGEISKNMQNQLSMIITSGKRLTNLVNEILDFSKLKYESIELQMKPVQISSVIDIVLAITKPILKNKPIHLINKVDDTLPPVLADENRLQQILYNLLDNAIKYTEKGTIIISAFADGEAVTINVTDTGKGISKDQLNVIFEPFQQGDASVSREVGGVGIGLNITKNLVDLHDGSLKVWSKIGEGSTFSITLPIYDKASQEKEVAVTVESIVNEEAELLQFPQQNMDNKQKILVVDDEIVNVQVLMNQLSLEGYEVFTALQGEDVFQIIKENDIDLLILDIMMPGMSGYEVCQRLRNKYTLMELPILMLTAKNQLQDKMLAFNAGANDYLVKPCDKQELLSRVKTLIQVKILNQKLIQMNLNLEEKVLERTHKLKVAYDNLQAMAASRRELLANIAHELGTPVTLVHTYVQSVQKGLISADDPHYGTLVTDKISVLNRLIEDLFDLSTLEAGKISFNFKDIRLDKWLEVIYDKCEFAVLQKNRIFKRMKTPLELENFTCTIDEERMDQLFFNLISNAIKNTRAKTGEITIEVKLLDSQQLMIQVSDNGLGIKKENLPYIFDRFYKKNSPEEELEGTGLGLAIVKQIVQSHKGEIWAESKENEGTTFYIVLPVSFNQKKAVAE